jgi:ribulose-phosphate 3-epimerase
MSLSSKKNFFYSVISDNPKDIFKNLKLFEESGVSGIHFDVMDGMFVPRLGLYPELLSQIRKETSLFIEVHAMVTTPSSFINKFAEAGANRIIYHVETSDNVSTLISITKDLGMECGLALNPATSIKLLEPFTHNLDAIMLMAINPGIPKHPFIDGTYAKLMTVKSLLAHIEGEREIIIDGGVTFDNLEQLFSDGANTLICGSGTLFSPGRTLTENLQLLKSKI